MKINIQKLISIQFYYSAYACLLIIAGLTLFSSCKDEESPKPIITLELQPGVEGMDAFISNYPNNDYPNRNFGNHPEFQASAWTAGGDEFVVRSLIQFNLASIPVNSQVKSAKLFLFGVDDTVNGPGHSTLTGSNEWSLIPVTSDWDEGTVSWNTQPVFDPASAIIIPASVLTVQDYETDITELVASMVKDPSKNHGFILKLIDESIYRRILFASSDHPVSSKRPKLVITY